MRRFRHRSGDAVGRKIERRRTLVEKHGASPVIEAGARQVPTRLQAGRLRRGSGSRARRRQDGAIWKGGFSDSSLPILGLTWQTAKSILDVMRLKNSA